MRRALALAKRGWGRTAPNPMVGAVVVRDGHIVGEGWHAELGAPHAEAMALQVAGGLARGATVYTTLEPCAHHGRTPPCAHALVQAGVERVVFAVRDPGEVAGGGAEVLRRAGIRVDEGPGSGEVRELIAPFLFAAGGGGAGAGVSARPWVTLKLAVSLDAALADATGQPGWLTGTRARREVHRMRAESDAVMVGVSTVLVDDPELTVRHGRRPRVAPLRVVLDRRFRTPLESRLVRGAREAPVAVIGLPDGDPASRQRAAALEASGARVGYAADVRAALELLRIWEVRHLFCEGGAGVAGSLLSADLADRLVIFQAPVILGAGSLPAFSGVPAVPLDAAPRWRAVRRASLGEDAMVVLARGE